jgi:two-component system, OmpR family, phosphate regulon sensor histidine kinase PhoR
VVDTNERVMRVNQAAERLFNIDARKVANRTVHEVIRNTDFHSFVGKTLSADSPVEGEIVILGDPDSYLQAHGVTLRNGAGRCIGGLVVIHDVTRLKTLENMRRDFVANVSHELKTPVTSIKGFLETLREGAFQDPQHAERFLDIIIRHTDRLSAIIEDLLSLSRIERYAEKGGINLEVGAIRSVFDSVSKICAVRAEAKGVSLGFIVDEALTARMNAPLLEQALVNLVDNAIKFSESGSAVKISARQAADGIFIHVEDKGCGIAKEQLPRIFERFYRVDKGRSRSAGGTGLGLSIVKHIAIVHGGNVTVRSSPGLGSTFTIHLPSIARAADA